MKKNKRLFSLTLAQNTNSFCPYCGKALWEELGHTNHFDCKVCKQEISNNGHKTISENELVTIVDSFKNSNKINTGNGIKKLTDLSSDDKINLVGIITIDSENFFKSVESDDEDKAFDIHVDKKFNEWLLKQEIDNNTVINVA